MRLVPCPRHFDLQINGEVIHLSPTESVIMACLLSAKTSVTIKELIDVVYGDDPEGGPLAASNCIRVMMCNLRRKLQRKGVYITGKCWQGYRLVEKAKAAP